MSYLGRIKAPVLRVGKIAAGLVLILIFLGLLSYLLILLPPVQNYSLSLAEKQFNSKLVGDISIGHIKSNLISQVDIYDLVVRDKSGSKDSVYIGHVRARYNLTALFAKTIHITSVLIEKINASLSVTADGRYIIPVLPVSSHVKSKSVANPADAHKGGWRIALGKVQVNQINAEYTDSSLHFQGFLRGASVMAMFPQIDSVLVELRVPEGSYESPWWRGHVDTIGGSATFRPDGMMVNEIFVEGAGSQVRGRGKIPFNESGFWDLSATVRSSMEPVLAIYSNVPGLKPSGQLYGRAFWTGTLQNPLLRFKGWGRNIVYETLEADSLYLDAEYGGESDAKATLNLYSSLGSAKADVKWQIPDLMLCPVFGDYYGNIRVENVIIPKLKGLKFIPQKFPGQFANFSGHFSGSGLEKLPEVVSIKARVKGKEFKNTPLGLSADLKNKRWHIKSEWERNILDGTGTISRQGVVTGKVTAQFLQLGPLSDYFFDELINGEIHLEADLNDKIENPTINARIAGHNITWRSAHIDSLDVNASYKDRDLNIEKAYLSATARLDSVLEYFNLDSTGGEVKVVARASGPVLNPDISARVEGLNLFYKSYNFDTVSGEFEMSGTDTIRWHDLNVTVAQTGVKSDGLLSPDGLHINTYAKFRQSGINGWRDAGELTLDGQFGGMLQGSFKMTDLELSVLSTWLFPKESYSGKLKGEGSFAGSFDNPGFKVSTQLAGPEFRGHQIHLLQNNIELADSLLKINSHIFLKKSGPGLELNAQIPLHIADGWKIDTSGGRDVKIGLNGNSLDLESAGDLLGADWTAKGPLYVDIGLDNKDGSWELNGNLSIKKGSLGYRPKNLTISDVGVDISFGGNIQDPSLQYVISTGLIEAPEGRISGSFARGVVGLDSLVLSAARLSLPQKGLVELSGLIPFGNRDSIISSSNLALDFVIVKFPLTLFSYFLPDNMIRGGEFRGDGRIRIKNGRPVLSGKIGLEGGILELEDIDPRIGPVNADIVMSGDSVILKQFKGKWGKGSIKGSGFGIWNTSGLSDLQIKTRSNNLSFELADMADITVQSANLQLTNRREGLLLSGSVDMGSTRFVRDLRITDLVREKVTSEKNRFLKNLMLQIKVNLLENLVVDMNLGYLEMDGEVGIAGTAFEPTYTGEISVTDGYVLYLDRKFDVVKGTFYNYDPYKLNPLIDLEAKTEVVSVSAGTEDFQSYTIYMTMSGSLEKPEVQFRAEDGGSGGLSQADMISILTLGQPIGAIGGDLGNRLRAFAGESLLGFGSRKLEQLLGIERIDFRGDIFKMKSEEKSPRLTLTKRLSSRLLLSYETALGDLTRRKILALFRLTKRFFLKGETDSEGESGVDLIFKLSR